MLVPTGEAALDYLAGRHPHGPPDLILLDQGLPGMCGLDVLRGVRAGATTRHMRVVMMSAMAEPGVVEEARRLGVERFLHKMDGFCDQLSELLAAG